MLEDVLSTIKNKYNSKSIEDCIEGIEISRSIINELTDLTLGLLDKGNIDKFILTEKTSMLFDTFLNRLIHLAESTESQASFWASCLLVHYNINNSIAYNNLIDAVSKSKDEQAEIAATLLTKRRYFPLIDVIKEKLINELDISPLKKSFFEEKIQILKDE